jgi:hypothetical protein
MATLKCIFLTVACAFVLGGCSSNPVGTGQNFSGVNLTGYYDGETAAYVKVFSDGTQNQFGGYDTVNSRIYYILLQSGESFTEKYYYDARGEEGFQGPGEPITWFDEPLADYPDHLSFDSTYTTKATYTYSGHNISYAETYVLNDTETVGVGFGIFRGCAHFIVQWKAVTDSVATYGMYDDYYAKGPGEIKIWYESDELPILMVNGDVNGVEWGPIRSPLVPSPMPSPATPAGAARLIHHGFAAASEPAR